MERSDNNRGGYNRGRGRGGRNYGGPQHGGRGGDGGGNGNYGGGQYGGRGGDGGGNGNYGGAQYGGRGGDGGGSGAGYYPRGRGRSGNNPQQYSNQRQEQYGGDGGGDGNYGGGQYGGRGGDGNYGGGQYGGRGGDGGGTGAGYYPRGRGRSGNYPQQHNNQQQEQYGGGRGRGSVGRGGGRGGDQPTYWNPTQSRQNADRVPDHSVRDRETKWSPTGSDHSVESPPPALTQIQNRVADLQIREPPRRQVERVSPSMDNEETANVPIKRPDYGTLGFRTVKLLVNHFPVRFDPSTAILRYDIDVKHDTASSSRAIKKAIPKSDLRLIQEKLCSENPNQFPLLQTAYDGEKNIYSAVKLPEGIYKVDLFGRSYTCSIKYGTELGLSKLQDFLKGNSIQIPREVLQALDVVMKANLYREKVSVGRGMYPRVHRKEDDLYGGVAAYRGSQQSLKVTSNGLVMCLDYSAVPFRKRMPVIDFLKECIWDIRDVNDIGKFGNKVVTALRGLRVGVTHRRTNQKYIVSGLTEMATKDISFELEDLEGKKETEVVMLTDYFREKWGKEIVYTGIPCLKLGSSKKPNYVPMEFCVLAEDRRFPKEQLGREAAKMLKDLSLLNPDCRRNEIRSMVRDEYAAGKNGAKVIKNFDFEVGMNMTEVTGRVMAPPQLKLGTLSGKTNTTTVDKVKCHWNLMNGKTLTEGKAAQRWALIDFTLNDRRNSLRDPNYFISKLINRCKSIGIEMENPIIVHPTNMREFSDINKLDRLLKQVVENCRRVDKGRLQMIVCVMADKHEGYKYLKWVSETQIGVITQCCLAQNANKANDQFLANLGMKINAKLGGSNVELIERFPLFDSNDRFMFIGADVNHPAASNQSSPSVAAVVGSVNFPAATRYAARVSPQTHRKEEIVNFGSLCVDLVNAYVQQNGVKPNRIIVFRDGVSDGQFDMVLNKEMVDMKKALYNHFDQNYRPFITYVVAQKRHTTRLFLNNGTEVGNVPPGTVVDTTIVQPFEFDFYLCSHFGGMGTSKATHYSVIWDENGFTSDEMQKLVYHLCYVFARCTKPVSLVPPVYYADLVAYRGRMFQEVAAESDTGSRSSGSEVSVCSFDRFFYDVEKSLKDSMFFI